MIKINKSTIAIIVLAVLLGMSFTYNIKAAGTLQSKGKLIYTNPSTGEVEVVIDTNDHKLLKDEIDINSNNIANNSNAINEINNYVNELDIKIDNQDTSIENIDIYVGEDGNLHFVDAGGADSVLPFSRGGKSKVVIGSGYYKKNIEKDCVVIVGTNNTNFKAYLDGVAIASVSNGYADQAQYYYGLWTTEEFVVKEGQTLEIKSTQSPDSDKYAGYMIVYSDTTS